MPSYDVAHINEQGQDIIIVPVDSDFGNSPKSEQDLFIVDFQRRCIYAGLRGVVVPVWINFYGNLGFIAPFEWHPFFQSLTMESVQVNINGNVHW